MLDGFDAHRIVIHIQRTCGFARRGANATCEFREVVGAVQHVNRFFPIRCLAVVHQIIEVWDDVIDRAAAVAKWCAAIHTTRCLCFSLLVVQTNDEFFVIFEAFWDRFITLFQALKLHKTGDFTHGIFLENILY